MYRSDFCLYDAVEQFRITTYEVTNVWAHGYFCDALNYKNYHLFFIFLHDTSVLFGKMES